MHFIHRWVRLKTEQNTYNNGVLNHLGDKNRTVRSIFSKSWTYLLYYNFDLLPSTKLCKMDIRSEHAHCMQPNVVCVRATRMRKRKCYDIYAVHHTILYMNVYYNHLMNHIWRLTTIPVKYALRHRTDHTNEYRNNRNYVGIGVQFYDFTNCLAFTMKL